MTVECCYIMLCYMLRVIHVMEHDIHNKVSSSDGLWPVPMQVCKCYFTCTICIPSSPLHQK
jgi:hypothetical protein